MQQGDYTSVPYYQFPHLRNPYSNSDPINHNPGPSDLHPDRYASAPPFTSDDKTSEYNPYPSSYHPHLLYSVSVPATTSTPPTLASPSAPPYPPTSNTDYKPTFNLTSQSPSFPPFESHPPYPPSSEQQPCQPPFDQHLSSAAGYGPTPSPNPNSTPNPSYSSPPSASYGQPTSSAPPAYGSMYEKPVKFDSSVSYFDDRSGGYNPVRYDLSSDGYSKMSDSGITRYDSGRDNLYGDGVYAYQGAQVEPRGTSPESSTWAGFDDYGRAINFPSTREFCTSSTKVVKAVPMADAQDDVKCGIQKFRVKLLAETSGQTTIDVLCQIGLDGIQMLDPSTSRTLRIYPLENIARCVKLDSSTLGFWSKSPVDVEPRRIRLQSNSYTTNTLLDTLTAATVQVKEMGGIRRPSESLGTKEQPSEKKKGIADWMNLRKPPNEEKDHWVPDEAVSKCTSCSTDFGAFIRKHHCRNCGDIFCDKCTQGRIALTADENSLPVRVCDQCMAEVTQRLGNAKEAAHKSTGLQSHDDLARKLQEELGRNRLKSDGLVSRMKEVACPTCTVHLQVQVPTSGSATIECGLCQNPFLVNAQ